MGRVLRHPPPSPRWIVNRRALGVNAGSIPTFDAIQRNCPSGKAAATRASSSPRKPNTFSGVVIYQHLALAVSSSRFCRFLALPPRGSRKPSKASPGASSRAGRGYCLEEVTTPSPAASAPGCPVPVDRQPGAGGMQTSRKRSTSPVAPRPSRAHAGLRRPQPRLGNLTLIAIGLVRPPACFGAFLLPPPAAPGTSREMVSQRTEASSPTPAGASTPAGHLTHCRAHRPPARGRPTITGASHWSAELYRA